MMKSQFTINVERVMSHYINKISELENEVERLKEFTGLDQFT